MIHETTWTVWPGEEMHELIGKVHHEYHWSTKFTSSTKPFTVAGVEPTFKSAYHALKTAEAEGLGIA